MQLRVHVPKSVSVQVHFDPCFALLQALPVPVARNVGSISYTTLVQFKNHNSALVNLFVML